MNDQPNIFVANWSTDNENIRKIREIVFIQEQSVPVDMEWDKDDEICTHFLILKNNEAIGTARLLKNGQIGRMAILKKHRNKGFGSNLLLYILEHAKNLGMTSTFVHAQETAINFYTQKGFISSGTIFMEANIPHQKMEKIL